MFLSSIDSGNRSIRKRFATYTALLVTGVVAISACATDAATPASVPPTAKPVSTPTQEAVADSAPDPTPTVQPAATSVASDRMVTNDLVGDPGADESASEDESDDAVDLDGSFADLMESFGGAGDSGGSFADLMASFGSGLFESTDESSDKLDYALSLDGNVLEPFDAIVMRQVWDQNLDAALVSSDCAATPPLEYPSSYYTGPLTDSHFHMPQISDDFSSRDEIEQQLMASMGFGGADDDDDGDDDGGGDEENSEEDGSSYGGTDGVDSELYNAIALEDIPTLGVTITLDEVACALRQEGTTKAYTFFPAFESSPSALIDLAYHAMDRHGDLFVPFIQTVGDNISTVEADVLEQMLDLRPDLFIGHGEIGDSPTEGLNPPPDDPIYIGDFEVARERDLVVWFHPGIGHYENLDRALKMFPDVTFVIHGDFIYPHVDDLMADNDNVFFTFNDIFGSLYEKFTFGDKQVFFDSMEQNWEDIIQEGLNLYEDLIYKYPDKFMWGTDRAALVWNYHADTGQLLAKLARDFIGRFDPEIQDKIAYLNAESLLQ